MSNLKISANGHGNLSRTPLQLEQDLKRQAIVDEILRLRPDTEFKINKYTTELVYYTVSVVKSKISTERQTRMIMLNSDPTKLVGYGYRTESEARKAIEAVLPLAQERFRECLKQYEKLTSEMGFAVGFNYDGDTHGIYNEYEYISFKMNGFDFQFAID